MTSRYLQAQILRDLSRKMVFLGGPRQVGKTTMAKQFITELNRVPKNNLTDNFDPHDGYMNWDTAEGHESILNHEFSPLPLLVFDEIHKYRQWRQTMKGVFDSMGRKKKILVTGSARLDYYRFGGDSLQGRYHYLRLHPLSFAEMGGRSIKDLDHLLQHGGFPEPFHAASESETRRWSREYRMRLVREDLSSLERVHDLGSIENLMIRLPDLVGAPLSINALREDLRVSHKAAAHWLDILERLYALVRLSPLGGAKIRAVKKEQKHYHFDWTLVRDLPFRFENLVALHLLKWVHFLEDSQGRDIELRYFRDIDGREVDFVVTEDRKPLWLIECKWNDAPVSSHLVYLKQKYPGAQAWQISATGSKDFETPEGIRVCPATVLLGQLV